LGCSWGGASGKSPVEGGAGALLQNNPSHQP